MTRNTRPNRAPPRTPRPRRRSARTGHWLLQDAKARFSELVRRANSEGPQHVTVHGRDEVVVISAAEYRRMKGDLTGQALVGLLKNSPLRDISFEHKSVRSPVRDVRL